MVNTVLLRAPKGKEKSEQFITESHVRLFRYSFSETTPISFNRLKL